MTEQRLRAEIARLILAQRAGCPAHPPVMVGGDCWTCGRNGAFTRAARIALGQPDPRWAQPSPTEAFFDPGLIGGEQPVRVVSGFRARIAAWLFGAGHVKVAQRVCGIKVREL